MLGTIDCTVMVSPFAFSTPVTFTVWAGYFSARFCLSSLYTFVLGSQHVESAEFFNAHAHAIRRRVSHGVRFEHFSVGMRGRMNVVRALGVRNLALKHVLFVASSDRNNACRYHRDYD